MNPRFLNRSRNVFDITFTAFTAFTAFTTFTAFTAFIAFITFGVGSVYQALGIV